MQPPPYAIEQDLLLQQATGSTAVHECLVPHNALHLVRDSKVWKCWSVRDSALPGKASWPWQEAAQQRIAHSATCLMRGSKAHKVWERCEVADDTVVLVLMHCDINQAAGSQAGLPWDGLHLLIVLHPVGDSGEG